jgi:hypothetical protein
MKTPTRVAYLRISRLTSQLGVHGSWVLTSSWPARRLHNSVDAAHLSIIDNNSSCSTTRDNRGDSVKSQVIPFWCTLATMQSSHLLHKWQVQSSNSRLVENKNLMFLEVLHDWLNAKFKPNAIMLVVSYFSYHWEPPVPSFSFFLIKNLKEPHFPVQGFVFDLIGPFLSVSGFTQVCQFCKIPNRETTLYDVKVGFMF